MRRFHLSRCSVGRFRPIAGGAALLRGSVGVGAISWTWWTWGFRVGIVVGEGSEDRRLEPHASNEAWESAPPDAELGMAYVPSEAVPLSGAEEFSQTAAQPIRNEASVGLQIPLNLSMGSVHGEVNSLRRYMTIQQMMVRLHWGR